MNIALTAFTSRGAELAGRLAKALTEDGHSCALWVPERLAPETGLPGYRSLGPWTGERFADSDALLFVGASGIAVRAIAPYVRDKFTDPAVVSVDEAGRFAVPLLSGHVGGANDLAWLVARRTGGTAAVSTATDVNGRFAVDQWAREQGFFLDGREGAKRVSAALLAGISVGMESDFPIQGPLPQGVVEGPAEAGIALTLDPEKRPFPHTVRLIPPVLHLGIGCRRGTPAATIAKAVEGVFRSRHLSLKGVAAVCSMVLFLSTGLLEEVERELMEGGYPPDTPAAIVYKATWPEQAVYRCTVSTLAATARAHHVTKTALITVGGFLGDKYDRSKLYDPAFTHGYREASK